jgi:hypothetical protein
VIVVPFREEVFLAGGAVGGFLEAGGGTAGPLAGEASVEPIGGVEEVVFDGETVGTSRIFKDGWNH